MVKINFINFQIIPMFKEASITDHLVQFYYDKQADKFLFVLKCVEENQDDIYKIQVYCLKSQAFQYETELQNQELIGRLSVGLHTFVGGHIIFGNSVFKIRYDLIDQPNCNQYTENEIFDIYENVFDVKSNEQFTSNSPLESI